MHPALQHHTIPYHAIYNIIMYSQQTFMCYGTEWMKKWTEVEYVMNIGKREYADGIMKWDYMNY